MIALRPAAARGVTRRPGLERQHSFSSGDYYDPAHMGFGALRVLDTDHATSACVAAGERRANMEILTWIGAGQAAWQAGGETGGIDAGTLDCLSAGSGIDHAIRAAAPYDLRSVQIWLQPHRVNAAPRHGIGSSCSAERVGLQVLASGDGDEGAWPLLADARVSVARLQEGETLPLRLASRRRAWLQVVRGALDVGSLLAASGDGVAISDEPLLAIRSRCSSELLLIELP